MTTSEVAAAVQLACLLEVSAPKPGNVSPGKHFRDLRYEDFLASAAAVGVPFTRVGERRVGETVRDAVDATASWVRTNTNLGIVLLLAPLARAACLRNQGDTLRATLKRVLDETTIDDARDVYAAIRRASPGGLGTSGEQDVAEEPTITLRDVMRLAADRDGVAREYATGFATTFDVSAPALRRARADGLSWDDAVVETFLTLLASSPDTHILRRSGAALAKDVSARARAVLDAGGVRTRGGREALQAMDAALRDASHAANPGTTADLTAAAIFVELIDGERGGGQAMPGPGTA
jgi:triphosphoribosyl-dephospho-CoA synthase